MELEFPAPLRERPVESLAADWRYLHTRARAAGRATQDRPIGGPHEQLTALVCSQLRKASCRPVFDAVITSADWRYVDSCARLTIIRPTKPKGRFWVAVGETREATAFVPSPGDFFVVRPEQLTFVIGWALQHWQVPPGLDRASDHCTISEHLSVLV